MCIETLSLGQIFRWFCSFSEHEYLFSFAIESGLIRVQDPVLSRILVALGCYCEFGDKPGIAYPVSQKWKLRSLGIVKKESWPWAYLCWCHTVGSLKRKGCMYMVMCAYVCVCVCVCMCVCVLFALTVVLILKFFLVGPNQFLVEWKIYFLGCYDKIDCSTLQFVKFLRLVLGTQPKIASQNQFREPSFVAPCGSTPSPGVLTIFHFLSFVLGSACVLSLFWVPLFLCSSLTSVTPARSVSCAKIIKQQT